MPLEFVATVLGANSGVGGPRMLMFSQRIALGAFVHDSEPTICQSFLQHVTLLFLPRASALSSLYLTPHSLKLNSPGKTKHLLREANRTGVGVCLVQCPLAIFLLCPPRRARDQYYQGQWWVPIEGVVLPEMVSSWLSHWGKDGGRGGGETGAMRLTLLPSVQPRPEVA